MSRKRVAIERKSMVMSQKNSIYLTHDSYRIFLAKRKHGHVMNLFHHTAALLLPHTFMLFFCFLRFIQYAALNQCI